MKNRNFTEDKIDLFKILSSISPLVLFDKKFEIKYINQSFINEFPLRKKNSILELFKDAEEIILIFKENVNLSKSKKIENAEFIFNKKLYGYTIFKYDEDYLLSIKEISEIKKLELEIEELNKELVKIGDLEKEEIAKKLHDDIIQNILAAKLYLGNFKNSNFKDLNLFQFCLDILDATKSEISIIHTEILPRSITELGFKSAILSEVEKKFSVYFKKLNILEPTELDQNSKNKLLKFIQILIQENKDSFESIELDLLSLKNKYKLSIKFLSNSKDFKVLLNSKMKAYLFFLKAKYKFKKEDSLKIEIPFTK